MKNYFNLFACCIFATSFSFAQPFVQHKPRLTILLDNGHGIQTAGKCSPDGRFHEFAWNREEVRMLEQCLSHRGYEVIPVVPEASDISINERVHRVNKICSEKGSKNCVLISIHCNAAPGEGWHSARGLMPFVAEENASNCSKRLAEKVFNAADRRNILGNRALPPEHFWRIKGIGMLRATLCPAILLECGFMDNRADLAFLQSTNGKEIIADLIVEAILAYEAELGL